MSITPLLLAQLPMQRRGLTDFTFSRYLVPWLCHYEGHALFLDADMLCLGDVIELEDCQSDVHAVKLVRHDERCEWPAVMQFNCARCRQLTPAWLDDESSAPQTFSWADSVGSLPDEWHYLVGYGAESPDAKLAHFTMGIPEFPETRGIEPEYAQAWHVDKQIALNSPSWLELMGASVHAPRVLAQLGLSIEQRAA